MQKMDSSDDIDLLRQILALVTVVCRPITLQELASLIGTWEGIDDDLESLQEIIKFCGSFLALQGHTIYIVHQSAKDFLLKSMDSKTCPSRVAELHYTVFSKSLEVMSRTLHRDVYSLHAPGFPINQVQRPDPDPLAAIRYSCVYWVEHLREWDSKIILANRNDLEEIGNTIDRFLRQRYLYWLEALSLAGSISEGVHAIIQLEGILEVRSQLAISPFL